MLAPKDFLDALSGQAARLFNGDTALPRNEIESQFKALLQSGFSKLDLVSREEFDSRWWYWRAPVPALKRWKPKWPKWKPDCCHLPSNRAAVPVGNGRVCMTP